MMRRDGRPFLRVRLQVDDDMSAEVDDDNEIAADDGVDFGSGFGGDPEAEEEWTDDTDPGFVLVSIAYEEFVEISEDAMREHLRRSEARR